MKDNSFEISSFIEAQEAHGQATVVNSSLLPKLINITSVPYDISHKGISPFMSSDQALEKLNENTERYRLDYTKEQYEKMRIKILEESGDLFYEVQLPAGWSLKATDHSMWTQLLDNNNRVRALMFYKAAFYDKDAFINFNTRFKIDVARTVDYDAPYDEWAAADLIGYVKDGDNIIFRTIPYTNPKEYSKLSRLQDDIRSQLESWLCLHYPDYQNIHAYWEEELHENTN